MKVCTKFFVSASIAMTAALLTRPVAAQVISTDPSLPPTNGVYATAQGVVARYMGGGSDFELTQIVIGPFTGISHMTSGPHEIDAFSVREFSATGSLFGFESRSGTGQFTVLGKAGQTVGTYAARMNQMDLTSDKLRMRIDPSRLSSGSITISDLGCNKFRITSFFDIFTEISLDNGTTWIPQVNGPLHIDLLTAVPEPGSGALGLASCAVAAGLWSRRKRCKSP